MPALGTCRVCQRTDVGEIDLRLIEGARVRTLSREIGLPEATLRTHRHRCRHLARFSETRAFAAAIELVREALKDFPFPEAQAAIDKALIRAGVAKKGQKNTVVLIDGTTSAGR